MNDENNPSHSPPFMNEDSLIQILLWVPVISLLRFKSVCKSWRAIIKNPFFIHNHAITFPTPIKNHQLGLGLGLGPLGIPPLFYRYSFNLFGGNIFTVSVGDDEFEDLGTPPPPYYNRNIENITLTGSDEDEEFVDITPPPSPPRWSNRDDYDSHPFKYVTVVGCTNGIICLHNTSYCNDIALWNPAIKQCRFLPKPFPLEGKRRRLVKDVYDVVIYFVGFGFDVKTKDYKVLQITSFKPDDKTNMDDQEKEYRYAQGVQVYSLITDSWKRCKDTTGTTLSNLIMHDDYWNLGHYLNGTYLFMAAYLYDDEEEEEEEATNNSRRKCFKPVIMSFDFTEENFRTIQFPFDRKNKIGGSEYIILFGEKIALTNACEVRSANGCYEGLDLDIWVLNDYGGNESWSKFYTFKSNSEPKFITDNGEFILLDGPKLQLLNLFTGEINDLKCDCEGSSRRYGVFISRVGVYKPSLVPIAGNGATDNNNLQV